jgi:hypothetical protein
MKAQPAAEAEKLIDKNDIIGNSAVDRSRQISGVNPLRFRYCPFLFGKNAQLKPQMRTHTF